GPSWRLDALAGYRYLHLRDRVGVAEHLLSLNPNNPNGVLPGTLIEVSDGFATVNDFHGFDLGLAGEARYGGLTLNVLGKLAAGGTAQEGTMAGPTPVAGPGFPPAVSPGGLLALATNSGRHQGGAFSLVPELDVRLGYQLTSRCQLLLGY